MDAKTKVNGIQPERCNAGSKAGLCNTQKGVQLSNEWILSHIDNSGLSASDRVNIRKAIEKPDENNKIGM